MSDTIRRQLGGTQRALGLYRLSLEGYTAGRMAFGEFSAYLLDVNPGQTTVQRIARLLRGRTHALIGAHARNSYLPLEPRATVDLDAIVPADEAADVVAAILAEIPGLSVEERAKGILAVLEEKRGRKVADILAADNALLLAALATAKARRVPSLGTMPVARRELVIALKLVAAASASRPYRKALLDMADAAALLEGRVDRAALQAALELAPARARRLLRKIERRERL